MRLKVRLIRQDKNSNDCGLACVSMLLRYYNINKTITELKSEIKVYENVGTYEPELAKYLLEQKFEVEIITMNPHLFTKKLKKKSDKELIFYLDNLAKNTKNRDFKEVEIYFEKVLKLGGKLNIKVPTREDVYDEIKKGNPLLVSVTSNFLFSKKANFNFHYNIITGIDEKYVYVNDPLWDERGGKHKYLIDDFIYAIYASAYGDMGNASLMKVWK